MSKHTQSPVTGYLIDPERQSIKAVHMAGGADHLASIQKLIGCAIITSASFDGGGLYCDDEGLSHDNVWYFFAIKGKTEPIAGRGLVLDVDDKGDDASPSFTLDEIKQRVSFLRPFAGGLWDRQWATKLHAHELNTLTGHLGSLEREAVQ